MKFKKNSFSLAKSSKAVVFKCLLLSNSCTNFPKFWHNSTTWYSEHVHWFHFIKCL